MPNQYLFHKGTDRFNIKLHSMLRLFLFGLSLLLIQSVTAQNDELGLRISYNTTENQSDIGMAGISLTGYYKFQTGEKFAIVPSFQYRKQRFRDNVLEIYQNVDVKYFSIPVTVRYSPFNRKPLNDFYILSGLQADLVIDAKVEDKSTGERKNVHNLFNYANGGYYYGLGYNIKRKIDVQIKWYQGLGNNYIEPTVSTTLEQNAFFEVSMAFILFTE